MSFHSIPSLNPLNVLSMISGSTLILPIVAIGNIPQLSVDLLISNLPEVQLIGRLNDTYLYPFASPIDIFNSESKTDTVDGHNIGISTALEIYYCEQLKITLIQQRSPVIPGLLNKFLKELIKPFIKTAEFSKVVLLQSQDKGMIELAELEPQGIHDLSGELFSIWSSLETGLDLMKLEHEDSGGVKEGRIKVFNDSAKVSIIGNALIHLMAVDTDESTRTKDDLIPDLASASWMSRSVSSINMLSKTSKTDTSDGTGNVEFVLFNVYVYEGDNSTDAELFTREIVKLLKLKVELKKQLNKPKSWLGLYGSRDIPLGMEYGIYT